MKKTISLVILLAFSVSLFSQSEKFGAISKNELQASSYEKDPSANAVVLFKKRRDHYKYDNNAGWSIISEVHERIKIYNPDGFDYASKKIPLYIGGAEQGITIKASTYNLENGKVEKTKLDKNQIFTEEINQYWESRNFTMPNLKEGTIVEWKYVINSPYTRNIDDITCQYDIPIKKLDCEIQVPEFYIFNHLGSQYYPITVEKNRIQKNYTLKTVNKDSRNALRGVTTGASYDNIKVLVNTYKILENDIPALVEEPFVNNINNYRAKIKFEISAYRPKNGVPEYFNTSWDEVTKTIYDNPLFGQQLSKNNYFEEDLNAILANIEHEDKKINTIYEFVKNKVAWNHDSYKYVDDGGVKRAYKDGSGNAAEVNLILVSMLKAAGINASPILVSTREHGIPIFPTTRGFNYVIAGIETDSNIILLDATEKYGSPNVLPRRDLNWEGRLIREDGTNMAVNLYPTSYNIKHVKLDAKIDSEGLLAGTMLTTINGLNALEYRNDYATGVDKDIISVIESKNEDIEVEQIRFRNKKANSQPLSEMIKFSQENSVDIIGDKIYVSPLLFLTMKENPFKLDERLYPIDYGSPWKNDTNIVLQLPEGYVIESKPEDLTLNLPNQMGTYTLKTELKNNRLFVNSKTIVNVPFITADYYNTIKELYKKAIENQLEKIVLVQQGP